jgi:hypothetical protein
MTNIAAYTPPGLAPPFLSINAPDEDSVTIHVRSEKDPLCVAAPQAQITIPLCQFYELMVAVRDWLKTKEGLSL